jgi:hypothetical protein
VREHAVSKEVVRFAEREREKERERQREREKERKLYKKYVSQKQRKAQTTPPPLSWTESVAES